MCGFTAAPRVRSGPGVKQTKSGAKRTKVLEGQLSGLEQSHGDLVRTSPLCQAGTVLKPLLSARLLVFARDWEIPFEVGVDNWEMIGPTIRVNDREFVESHLQKTSINWIFGNTAE